MPHRGTTEVAMTATTERALPRREAPAGFDPRPFIDGLPALMAGGANVIMQLGLPGVGYGVVESKVTDGQATRHPVKRARTTFTYLAVAMLGNDRDRALYRKAVNTQHAQVRSSAQSPVEYNAFNPELQRWVAACLYWGSEDVYLKLHGPVPADKADAFYQYGARMGTTLQMRPELWPADRAAFEAYWNEGLSRITIDDTVREYLDGLVNLGNLPGSLRRIFAGFNRFVTIGYLPQQFRDEMHYDWTPRDQQRFERMLRAIALVHTRMPEVIRIFPFNFFLWDLRRRVRTGKPLV
jgi:uncharacterized protein (DUF2236 family)